MNNRRSWSHSSEPFAGVGVAHRHHEEAEAKAQHEYVQHEALLCVVICGAERSDPFRLRAVGGATLGIGFRDGGNGNVIGTP